MGAEPVGQRGRHFDPQRPSASTRIVSLPPALPDSPSAVKNIRDASHRPRHCARSSRRRARFWRVRHNRLPPIVIDGRPAASAASASASRCPQHRQPAGLGEPLRRIRIPAYRAARPSPRTTRRFLCRGGYFAGSQRAPRLSTVIAARRSATWALKPAHAELVLVLAPRG